MNPNQFFALQDPRNDKWITYDPAADRYSICEIQDLKIWDVWDLELAQYISKEKPVISQGLIIKPLTENSIGLLTFTLL